MSQPRFVVKFVNGYHRVFDRVAYREVGHPFGLRSAAVKDAARRNPPTPAFGR